MKKRGTNKYKKLSRLVVVRHSWINVRKTYFISSLIRVSDEYTLNVYSLISVCRLVL